MSLYLIIYGAGRAWIEGLRGDSLYIGSIKVSQLLSILLILLGIVILTIIYIQTKKGKIKSVQEKYFPEFVANQNRLAIEKKEQNKKRKEEKNIFKKEEYKSKKSDKEDNKDKE